jgi:ERF superfamily
MKVYQKIAAVTAELSKSGIAKSGKNEQQGYKFRGIDQVYQSLSSVIAREQLCILPRVVSREVSERVTPRGGVLFYTVLTVEFDFVCAEDGSKHTIVTIGEAMDSGDKSTNKAMSAAYKYAAIQTFCIPVEGEQDADATTHEVSHPVLEVIANITTVAELTAAFKELSESDRRALQGAFSARRKAIEATAHKEAA